MYSYGFVNRLTESHASGNLSIQPFMVLRWTFSEGFKQKDGRSDNSVRVVSFS